MGLTTTILAELVGLASVVMTDVCLAHDAPSGWPYPPECCDGHDCYVIGSDEVEVRRDGSYLIRKTGEVFFTPGSALLGPWHNNFRWSMDGNFHRCSLRGERSNLTYCLFVPPPPS